MTKDDISRAPAPDASTPSSSEEVEETAALIVTGASPTIEVFHAVYDPESFIYDRDIEYNMRANLVHRIEAINTNGDRAVITKGDGNGGKDPRPVMASGYLYKAIWYKNGFGIPLQVLILHDGLLYLIVATLVAGALSLIAHIGSIAGKQEK